MSDDPRTGVLLLKERDTSKTQVDIVGFPFDEGVRRNGGRVGAAGGPAAVRPFIQKLGTVVNPEFGIDLNNLSVQDSGDITADNLEDAHKLLEDKVFEIIKNGSTPFVIGGGNDQSFPNAMGLLRNVTKSRSVGVVNIDAHLDVRPLKENQVHSGSPFYLLLNSGIIIALDLINM